MSETELLLYSETLAKALNGKLRRSRAGYLGDPFCPFLICGAANGLKATLYLGTSGGLAVLQRYQAPCPFEIFLFMPEPNLAPSEITQPVNAPVPVYANPVRHDADCIRQIFSNWADWQPVLDNFKTLGKPLMIASEQCQFFFSGNFIPNLHEAISRLAHRLAMPPFVVLPKTHIASRYSDKPYIRLEEKNVPPVLRPLLPLASRWSIAEETEVLAFAKKVGSPAVKEFLAAFRAHQSEIERFCYSRSEGQPFTDEAVAFQLACQAFGLLAARCL